MIGHVIECAILAACTAAMLMACYGVVCAVAVACRPDK